MQAANETLDSSAFPTALEALLLQAAVGNPARAADNLTAWKNASNFAKYSDVDFAATRLLPLVFSNLKSAEETFDKSDNCQEPWLPQLAGLHRYHWLQNAARQRDLLEVTEALANANVDAIVLGGLSLLAAGCFNDLGERPVMKRQILISPKDAMRARKVLSACGWNPPATSPPIAGWKSSEWWTRGEKEVFRVRYQWLPKGYPSAPVGRLLERSRIASLGGLRIRIPDPTDLLLMACLWNRRQMRDGSHRFVWAADAMRVLQRTQSPFDWNRLLRESREWKTLHPLRESLRYLRNAFGTSVPDNFLEAAFRVPLSDLDCEPFWRAAGPISPGILAPQAKTLARPYREYFAAERAAGRAPTLRGLIYYWTWRVRSELNRHRKAS